MSRSTICKCKRMAYDTPESALDSSRHTFTGVGSLGSGEANKLSSGCACRLVQSFGDNGNY